MTDILEKIAAYKREEIAAAKKARPLAEIERGAKAAAPPRGFLRAIEKKIAAGSYALIAEIKKASGGELRGGDAETNATSLLDVLKGKNGPLRDVATLNAAAALVVAGRAKDLKDGLALASKAIDSAEALARLDRLVAVSNMAMAESAQP